MMNTQANDINGQVDSRKQLIDIPTELLDVKAVAQLLGYCSTRHIYRLTDAGHMPRSIRLGSLIRWRRSELMSWIEAGCPKAWSGKQVTL